MHIYTNIQENRPEHTHQQQGNEEASSGPNCTHANAHPCTYRHTHTLVCIYVYIYIYIYTHTYMHMY